MPPQDAAQHHQELLDLIFYSIIALTFCLGWIAGHQR